MCVDELSLSLDELTLHEEDLLNNSHSLTHDRTDAQGVSSERSHKHALSTMPCMPCMPRPFRQKKHRRTDGPTHKAREVDLRRAKEVVAAAAAFVVAYGIVVVVVVVAYGIVVVVVVVVAYGVVVVVVVVQGCCCSGLLLLLVVVVVVVGIPQTRRPARRNRGFPKPEAGQVNKRHLFFFRLARAAASCC